MSILSYLRNGSSAASLVSRSNRRRGARVRSSSASVIRRAALEALEVRRLMAVDVADDNPDTGNPSAFDSFQYFGPFVSADGRYVAYDSAASDLIVSDAGSSGQQVYLHDRTLDINIPVTTNQFGLPASGNAFVAGMTDDARYILYFSTADDIVANDGNGLMDLFRLDRQTNTTLLISRDKSGAAVGVATDFFSGLPAYPAYISADGNRIAFISAADNVADVADNKQPRTVADDTNAANDIFVRDIQQQTTYLVTATNIGTGPALGFAANPGNIESYAMSDDGLYVAFATDSDNVFAGDVNGTTDVFRRNVNTGVTNLLTGDDQDVPLGLSYHVAISGDGSTVAFLSDEPTFAGGGGTPQVIVWDGANNIASGGTAGDPDGVALGFPVLSQDGRYVFFRSTSTDLVSTGTPAGVNVFRRDTQGDFTEVVSFGATGATGGVFNFDPLYAGGPDDRYGFASRISITPDGRFATWADNSTGADPNVTTYPPGATHVYVRDMLSARPALLDVSSSSPTTAAGGTSVAPFISEDASIVSFVSFGGTNLVGGSPGIHVYFASVPPFNPNTGTGNQQPTYILNAPSINQAGASSYTFQVTYRSPRPIDVSTLGANDVSVLDPNDVALPGGVFFVGANSSGDANVVTATYRVIPPGGSWSFADNGVYTIRLNAGNVSDVSGFQFPAQNTDLGTFAVNVPVTPTAGPTLNVAVAESVGSYTLTFTRNDIGDVPVGFVTYRIIARGAVQGEDFNVTSPSIVLSGVIGGIAPGGTAQITFQIVNDTIVEGPESIEVILSGAAFGVTFDYQRALITINDDDATGSGQVLVPGAVNTDPGAGETPGSTVTLNNGVPTVTAPETAGDVVIPLSRAGTNTTGSVVTFNYIVYAVPSDTAVPGQNFVADTGTITFGAGSDVPTSVVSSALGTLDKLRVRLLHDNLPSGDRTFTVVLTNASTGVEIGGTSIQVVVLDVDAAVQFGESFVNTTDDADVIAIPVTRIGNTAAASTVTISVAGGSTAVEGVDFEFLNDGLGAGRTLTFAAGETSKVIYIRALSRPFNPGTFRDLLLAITSPQSSTAPYATFAGQPSTLTVRFQNVDQTGPKVSAVNFTTKDGRINTVTVRFDEPVRPATARTLSNYSLFPRGSAGKLNQLVRFSSARYNADNQTVTLVPSATLPASALYQLNVNGRGTIRDLVGNRLDGDGDGKVGGSAVAVFGNGRALSYTDRDNDVVSFRLDGSAGTLKYINLNNQVTLDVFGGQNSTLLGSVTRRRGGDGTADPLIRLNGAQFDPGDDFVGDIQAAIKRAAKRSK